MITDDGAILYEPGTGTGTGTETGFDPSVPVHERTVELISDPQYSGIRSGQPDDGPANGGIHIHVEPDTLQNLFEKIPWEDLVDSFNNKLTHKQEIRFADACNIISVV